MESVKEYYGKILGTTFENHLGIFKDCGKKIPFQTNNCDKMSGCC